MSTQLSPGIARRRISLRRVVQLPRTTFGRQSVRLALLCALTAIAFGIVGSGQLVDALAAGGSLASVALVVMFKLLLVVGAAATGLGAVAQAVLAYVEQGERSALLALPVATGVIVAAAMIAQMLFPG